MLIFGQGGGTNGGKNGGKWVSVLDSRYQRTWRLGDLIDNGFWFFSTEK